MERIAYRSTSNLALIAELHRQDLLRKAAGPRAAPVPSFAGELRLLLRDVTRRLLPIRRGGPAQPAVASGVPRTASRPSATTRIPSSISSSVTVPYPNRSPGRAVACVE